jgi:hypothetical protein
MDKKGHPETEMKALLTRRRLCSWSEDRENEEFNVAKEIGAEITLTGLIGAQGDLMEALNQIELRTRANHRELKQRIREIEIAEEHTRVMKAEAERRKLAAQILEIVRKKPETGLSDLAGVLEKSEREVENAVNMLMDEGKLKHTVCRRQWEAVQNPEEREAADFQVEDEDEGARGPHYGQH